MRLKVKRTRMNLNEVQRDQVQEAVREVLLEFCSNSSIHGVQYFSNRKRHWTERCWWIVAFGLSLWFCGSSIHNIWAKWCNNPVTMSFSEKESPISAIPFPTVTICPETKTYKDKFDVTAAYHSLMAGNNLTDAELIGMKVLVHLCQFGIFDLVEDDQFANDSIFTVMKNMAPSLDDTIITCTFQYSDPDCSDLFVPIITDEGLCFTFNSLNSHEIYTNEMAPEIMTVKNNTNMTHWRMDTGYDADADEDSYPIRVYNAKNEGALVVLLRLGQKDLEYFCRGSVQGFKVILHTPGQILKTSRHTFRVPLSEEAEIWITPKMITTSEELRDYKPNERKCFFNSERQLRFFKLYTQYNCEAECLANFTKKECNCVKFSMPRDTSTKICGASSVSCYTTAEKQLFGEDVIDGLKDNGAKLFRQNCNCLPSCTSIIYDAEIDRARFNWKETLKSYKVPVEQFSTMQASSVKIFFRDHDVVTLKRSERYTYTDFLAVCGGLLGLFLGVSALSIIEFLYYATLRLYWTLRQWKSENTVTPFNRRPINSVSIDIPST